MIGDLIFVKNRGWFYDKIREVTKSEFDHVAMFISDSLIVEALPFRGVAIKNIRRYRNSIAEVYELKDKTVLPKMVEYLLICVGKPYDWVKFFSICWLLLTKAKQEIDPFDIKDAYLCSELVVNAGEFAGISFRDGYNEDMITPGDLYGSELIQKIDRLWRVNGN